MKRRTTKSEAEQARENARAWVVVVRDVEKRQVDALLASVGLGNLVFQPRVVEALVRQFVIESDEFATWVEERVVQAQGDLRKREAA